MINVYTFYKNQSKHQLSRRSNEITHGPLGSEMANYSTFLDSGPLRAGHNVVDNLSLNSRFVLF